MQPYTGHVLVKNSNTKKRLVFLILALCYLFFGLSIAKAFESPAGWPWRGVNIDSIDFDARQLKEVIKKIAINSVQIRLRPRELSKISNISAKEAWTQSLTWAKDMLDECKKTGIVGIISVEGFPIDPAVGYDQTSPLFWYSSRDKQDVINLASDLAKHFSLRGPELVAYQFLSEPVMIVGGKNFLPPQWNTFIADLVAAIRKNDPERWIAVAAGPWGLPSSYKNYEPLPFPKIVYSAHMYVPHTYTHQGIRKYKEKYTYPGIINGEKWDKERLVSELAVLKSFYSEHRVPVWIGEFSAIRWAPGAELYVSDLINIFDDYGWAWTYFSLNGWHGWNPDYDHHRTIKNEWKQQNVGGDSKRWKTLRRAFSATIPGDLIQKN